MENYNIITDGELRRIELSLLIPSPLNNYPIGDITSLMGSIKSCGLITPLSVIGPANDGTYTILAGERRITAIRNLIDSGDYSLDSLPCYILGPITMPEIEQKLIIESSNLESRDEADYNKNEHRMNIIRLLKKMADDGSIKHSQIVERAGYYMKGSARYRKMFLQVFENANPIVRGLMEKGKIKVTDASKLSYLPDEAQEEIIAQVQMGGDLESLYQAYKNRDTDTDDLSVREDKSDEVRNQRETVGQETNFRNFYPGYDMVGPSDGKMPVPMEERESAPKTFEDSKKTVSETQVETRLERPQKPAFNRQKVLDALGMGTEFEDQLLDMEYYEGTDSYYNDYIKSDTSSMNLDTTGELGRVTSYSSGSSNEKLVKNRDAEIVVKWCRRIMNQQEELSDDDLEAVEVCKELVEYLA